MLLIAVMDVYAPFIVVSGNPFGFGYRNGVYIAEPAWVKDEDFPASIQRLQPIFTNGNCRITKSSDELAWEFIDDDELVDVNADLFDDWSQFTVTDRTSLKTWFMNHRFSFLHIVLTFWLFILFRNT